jgi:hypothetical protein
MEDYSCKLKARIGNKAIYKKVENLRVKELQDLGFVYDRTENSRSIENIKYLWLSRRGYKNNIIIFSNDDSSPITVRISAILDKNHDDAKKVSRKIKRDLSKLLETKLIEI